jgi:hypothetical protein
MQCAAPQFLLVEPIAKTPFPPLGLMKISTLLKKKYPRCEIFSQVGNETPTGLCRPDEIYITSLFTWDLDSVVKSIHFYQDKFPRARIHVGGVAASVMPGHIKKLTGIDPHIGLLDEAEGYSPDYSLNFGRKIRASITFASRGCPRDCKFCSVKIHEPLFYVRNNWEKDIDLNLPRIVFWDNNWLASPNFSKDCEKIKQFSKIIDFNQGLDARLLNDKIAKKLFSINLDPIRFAFDDVKSEKQIIKAIRLAKKYSNREVRVYVLYNYQDSPEDFYYRIDLLNKEGVLSFPMEYRKTTPSKIKFPGPNWNSGLLRALKLSLLFYYRKGMITPSRKSFLSIYGGNAIDFIDKLYSIYEYDKTVKVRKPKSVTS